MKQKIILRTSHFLTFFILMFFSEFFLFYQLPIELFCVLGFIICAVSAHFTLKISTFFESELKVYYFARFFCRKKVIKYTDIDRIAYIQGSKVSVIKVYSNKKKYELPMGSFVDNKRIAVFFDKLVELNIPIDIYAMLGVFDKYKSPELLEKQKKLSKPKYAKRVPIKKKR